jgi:glycosyltransferase involved in cell wall biosynthesis
MPRSLVEAMSMALPVVAADIAGCNEAVQNERSGLLVPKGSVSALSQAVLRLFENEQFRRDLGHRARQRVLARFTREKVAAQTHSCYQQLLNPANPER